MTNTTTERTSVQLTMELPHITEQSAFLDFANRPSATRIFVGTNPETGEKDFDYEYRNYRIVKAIKTETGEGYFICKILEEEVNDGKIGEPTHWTLTVRDAKSIIDTIVNISSGRKVTKGRKQSVQLRADIAADLAVA